MDNNKITFKLSVCSLKEKKQDKRKRPQSKFLYEKTNKRDIKDNEISTRHFLVQYTKKMLSLIKETLLNIEGNVSVEKKKRLFDLFITQRNLLLKIIVVFKWITNIKEYNLVIEGLFSLNKEKERIINCADSLFSLSVDLKKKARRSYNIKRAIEILSCSTFTHPNYIKGLIEKKQNRNIEEIKYNIIKTCSLEKIKNIKIENNDVLYHKRGHVFFFDFKKNSWFLKHILKKIFFNLQYGRIWKSLEEAIEEVELELNEKIHSPIIMKIKNYFSLKTEFNVDFKEKTFYIEKETSFYIFQAKILFFKETIVYKHNETEEIIHKNEIEIQLDNLINSSIQELNKTKLKELQKIFLEKEKQKVFLETQNGNEVVLTIENVFAIFKVFFQEYSLIVLEKKNQIIEKEQKTSFIKISDVFSYIVFSIQVYYVIEKIKKFCTENLFVFYIKKQKKKIILKKDEYIFLEIYIDDLFLKIETSNGEFFSFSLFDERIEFFLKECILSEQMYFLKKNISKFGVLFFEQKNSITLRKEEENFVFEILLQKEFFVFNCLFNKEQLFSFKVKTIEFILFLYEKTKSWFLLLKEIEQKKPKNIFIINKRKIEFFETTKYNLLFNENGEIILNDDDFLFNLTKKDFLFLKEKDITQFFLWLKNCLVFQKLRKKIKNACTYSQTIDCFTIWKDKRMLFIKQEEEFISLNFEYCFQNKEVDLFQTKIPHIKKEIHFEIKKEYLVEFVTKLCLFTNVLDELIFFLKVIKETKRKNILFKKEETKFYYVFEWGNIFIYPKKNTWFVEINCENIKVHEELIFFSSIPPEKTNSIENINHKKKIFIALTNLFEYDEKCLKNLFFTLFSKKQKLLMLQLIINREREDQKIAFYFDEETISFLFVLKEKHSKNFFYLPLKLDFKMKRVFLCDSIVSFLPEKKIKYNNLIMEINNKKQNRINTFSELIFILKENHFEFFRIFEKQKH